MRRRDTHKDLYGVHIYFEKDHVYDYAVRFPWR